MWLCWYKSREVAGVGAPGGSAWGLLTAGNKATGDNVKCASGVCTAAVGLR